MRKIKFIFEKNVFEMVVKEKDLIKNILEKYAILLFIAIKDLIFFYKGKNLSLLIDKKYKINSLKNKNIIITVFKKKISINKNELANIICPECKNLTFFNINDDKISINNCKNNHQNNYSINEFIESQYIDENEIKCNLCENNKYLYDNNFYICTCGINICQLCMKEHIKNKNHHLLYFNKQFSFCQKHIIEYISYCSLCNSNLCEKCEKEHIGHKNKIILYKKEKFDNKRKNEMKKEINDIIFKIKVYKEQIDTINYIFNSINQDLKKELDNYNILYNKMLILLDNLNNYQNIKNMLNMNYQNNFVKDIDNFLNENLVYKISYLIKKCGYLGETILTYNINKNDNKIKLFGEEFVKNNKDNFNLIIDNKKINLSEYYYLDNANNNNELRVILLEKNIITNMSYMFYKCSSLSSLFNISKWNTINVIDMSYMFYDCESLISLTEISKWNTTNVTNINHMFCDCLLLSFLPDISKWNTSNLIDMSHLFYDCISIPFLPDISKWNTINVKNMSYIFYNCSSLSYLPDISKWNTINVNTMNHMFYDCRSLSYLPDISKWNTLNVKDMSYMFYNCESLLSLPEISNWFTDNIKDMSYMISSCKLLKSLPDISKWNTNNVIDMRYMFADCESLSSLPDISKWDIHKVINMSHMFRFCSSSSSFPKIYSWNTNNRDMSYMFSCCQFSH